MPVTSKYQNKSLAVTVSKDSLEYLLTNGYVTYRIALGKMPVDAGTVTLTLNVSAQETLKQIYKAETEVFNGKAKEPAEEPQEPETEQTDGKK